MRQQESIGQFLLRGHFLLGERTLQLRHIEQLAAVMDIFKKDLLAQEQQQNK